MKNSKLKKVLIGSFISLAVVVSIITITSIRTKKTSAQSSSLTGESAQALNLVNEVRVKEKVKPLSWNEKLAAAAKEKAEDMNKNGYFDHVSPNNKKAWDFVLDQNYNYRFAGENLATEYDSVQDAMNAWEESPSHLENIIDPRYCEFGFASMEINMMGEKSKIYVQIFGREQPIYERVIYNISKNNK